MIDAVVIGAGQAGLSTSHHLTRLGLEHVVLEQGAIGDTWRTQRWDSFCLNTPNWMNLLAGETEPIQPRDVILTRDEYLARLETYADDNRVPLRTGTAVTTVEGGPGEGTFRVQTRGVDGESELVARSVVVASGLQRVPKIPAIAASLPAGIRQLAASEYRNADRLEPGAVLVVGAAQSGVQITEDLLDHGRMVYLCTSSVPRLRRRFRGRDTLAWLVEAGFWEVRLDQLSDPKVRDVRLPLTSGVGRYGHTVSLQFLAERGAILLGRPTAIDGDRLLLDDTLGANIAFGDRWSAELKAGIDKRLADAGEPLPALEADPADEPHPDPIAVHSPAVLDLGTSGIGTVIWTTGFVGDLGFMHLPVVGDDGRPEHERGVAAVPGIYFVGFPWLWTRKSGIIHGVGEDAGYVADRLTERLRGVNSPGRA